MKDQRTAQTPGSIGVDVEMVDPLNGADLKVASQLEPGIEVGQALSRETDEDSHESTDMENLDDFDNFIEFEEIHGRGV